MGGVVSRVASTIVGIGLSSSDESSYRIINTSNSISIYRIVSISSKKYRFFSINRDNIYLLR